jgi:catechol 2,3-dioxygenase-like lactoylglutathione lyase family enzyme
MKKLPVRMLLVAAALAALLNLAAQSLPAPEEAKPTVDLAIYRQVTHVGWVVKDLDRVVAYWEKLGLRNIHRNGVQEFPDVTYGGKKTPLSLKMAFANLGNVQIEWIQPVKGKSVYDEFLHPHGDGIHHLAYSVASPAQLDQQVAYFKARGLEVIQSGSWQGTKGLGRFVYLDTAPKGGGITFELVYDPDAPMAATAAKSDNEYPFNNTVQYALVVRDVKKVGAYYQSLGFGRMPVDHNISIDRVYRGKPAKFEMYLGWWHWGDVTFEWIQSLVGPSVYDEALKAHGEGFHHLAFEVKDMDEAVKLLAARGAPVSQTGGWDSPGGKGRFAYLDTDPYGGVTIELLWNAPSK